ncbi:peptidoglycan-binding domain-containing protein [Marinactinospora rubrisoli]|uniref:Peptidoglycan-binding protein n=1 Tax=Marinactinospora rubrisoli TaxID=2715399 RepID=A0ABW2KG01_9ACTN
MRRLRVESRGTALLAGLVLLTSGGAVGFLLRPADPPTELAEADAPTSAPTSVAEFADERTVEVEFDIPAALALEVGFAGRVTSTRCADGAEIRSGQVVARIDDIPLVALATSVPLYRDLERGDRGSDVRALQTALSRLGHPAASDGTYGRQTAEAVRALQEEAGFRDPDGAVDVDRFMWLPAEEVTLDGCEAALGRNLAAGETYGTVANQLTAVSATSMPGGALPGERTIEVLGVSGPMDEDGRATDPEFLAELAATDEFREVTASEDADPVTAEIRLASPVRAVKVPPAAVFAIEGGSGCVESGETAYPVQIVGSNLGATLVELAGDPPAEVDLGPAITAETCGREP